MTAKKSDTDKDELKNKKDDKDSRLPHCSLCHKPIKKGDEYSISDVTGDYRHEGGCPKSTKEDEELPEKTMRIGADQDVPYDGPHNPVALTGVGHDDEYDEPEVRKA